MRKLVFCVYRSASDQRLCSIYMIVQHLYFLNPKFQNSGHLLRLNNPACIERGRKFGAMFSENHATRLISHGKISFSKTSLYFTGKCNCCIYCLAKYITDSETETQYRTQSKNTCNFNSLITSVIQRIMYYFDYVHPPLFNMSHFINGEFIQIA